MVYRLLLFLRHHFCPVALWMLDNTDRTTYGEDNMEITLKEVQEYVSFIEEVPDECGKMPDGRYNTRFLGQYGEYAFMYLPADLAEALQEDVEEAKKGDICHKISGLRNGDQAFVCNLKEGHDGLCVAASSNNTVVAVFIPVGSKKIAILYAMVNMIKRTAGECEDDDE